MIVFLHLSTLSTLTSILYCVIMLFLLTLLTLFNVLYYMIICIIVSFFRLFRPHSMYCTVHNIYNIHYSELLSTLRPHTVNSYNFLNNGPIFNCFIPLELSQPHLFISGFIFAILLIRLKESKETAWL